MKKIKYIKFFIEEEKRKEYFLYGVSKIKIANDLDSYQRCFIGIFNDRQTANFIKKLLTATLIKKWK